MVIGKTWDVGEEAHVRGMIMNVVLDVLDLFNNDKYMKVNVPCD